jgi:hypothetical protein
LYQVVSGQGTTAEAAGYAPLQISFLGVYDRNFEPWIAAEKELHQNVVGGTREVGMDVVSMDVVRVLQPKFGDDTVTARKRDGPA